MDNVVALYNRHPINEGEVLSKLQADGKDLDALQPADLLRYDQDHYGGTEATDALADRIGLQPGMRVLDVCAGLGGTSRYLAWKYGCTVQGVDLTASRVAGAQALTERVCLQDRVSFLQADATQLAVSPAGFDAAIGQEAFIHIADKAALLGGCHRMLRDGGRLGFTDILGGPGLTEREQARLREDIAFNAFVSADEYEAQLRAAGFREVGREDLSPWWSRILRDRLEMFRSLEAETVKRYGREAHDRYIAIYELFVDCMESGRLGGGRFVATK